ncbi:MAG: hypothetical protein KR126chlam6_01372 [Candidatus Anoxychlamydiales bacterium]|nr:hypothetical protein [Candidatus Anoxychlamydiales bacterium]
MASIAKLSTLCLYPLAQSKMKIPDLTVYDGIKDISEIFQQSMIAASKDLPDMKNETFEEIYNFVITRNESGEKKSNEDRLYSYLLPEACKRKESSKVSELLEKTQAANIKFEKESLDKSFSFAAENGDSDLITVLFTVGADINLCFDNKKSPLLKAIKNGHYETAKMLLDKIMEHDERLDTDLKKNLIYFSAAATGHNAVIRALLEKFHYDVNKTNIYDNEDLSKDTALHFAAKNNHYETVLLLIDKNIKLFRNGSNRTPLSLAAMNGYKNIVNYLIGIIKSKYSSNRDNWLSNSLYVASKYGQNEIVKIFLEEGCCLRFDVLRRALDLAAANDHLDTFQIILENIKDINETNEEGQTIFLFACMNGEIKTVRAMLKYRRKKDPSKSIVENSNVLINVRDNDFHTPLMWAAFFGYLEIVKELIKAKADINACTQYSFSSIFNFEYPCYLGCTALEMAAIQNKEETVKELLKVGAKVEYHPILKGGYSIQNLWISRFFKNTKKKVEKIKRHSF